MSRIVDLNRTPFLPADLRARGGGGGVFVVPGYAREGEGGRARAPDADVMQSRCRRDRVTAAAAPTDDDAAKNGKTKKSEKKSGVCGCGASLLRGPTADGPAPSAPARFILRVSGPRLLAAAAGGQRYYVYVHHQYKCVFGNCDPNAMRSVAVGQSVGRSVDLSSFASFQTAAASLHTRCTCTRSANSRGRSGDRSLQKTRFHGGRRSVVVLSPLFVLTFALTV